MTDDVEASWPSATGVRAKYAVIYDAARPRGWRRLARLLTRDRWPSPVIAFAKFGGTGAGFRFNADGSVTIDDPDEVDA